VIHVDVPRKRKSDAVGKKVFVEFEFKRIQILVFPLYTYMHAQNLLY
jgi:hypothetical protein